MASALFLQAETITSDGFQNFANGEPCILGIDEAGRGPILGPMVYACAISPVSDSQQLKDLGVADSKTLNEKKREAIFKRINDPEYAKHIAYAFQRLSAKYISAHMLSMAKPTNLNTISHNSAFALIQSALDAKINVTEIYVDTVGPPLTYQKLLESKFEGIKITVAAKADFLFPIVSAASIVAKVARDATFKNFDRSTLNGSRKSLGSGYPGDPGTKDYMFHEIDPIFGYSDFVRFSWKTADNALDAGCVSCKWIDPNPPQTMLDFFSRTSGPIALGKSSFFKERKPFVFPNSDGAWPPLQLRVYVSTRSDWQKLEQIFVKADVDLTKPFDEVISFNVPAPVRRNGTLYAYVFAVANDFIHPDIEEAPWISRSQLPLTMYEHPAAATFNLMSNSSAKNSNTKPVTHLHSILPIHLVSEALVLDRRTIPEELRYHLLFIEERKKYLPLLDVDLLKMRLKDLVEVKPDSITMNLTIIYQPISWGRLRLSAIMSGSFAQLKALGFTNKDFDDVKSMFSDTNFLFLAMTIVVATVHLLFDFLSFKNDVSFWKGRKTMVGISSKTLLWRCLSETIVFLYLWDERTSYLVLIPAGIGALVEYWKLQRAMKVSIRWDGWVPRLQFGEMSEDEKTTESFDSEGMRYLTYLLIPLCIAGAIYNLIYVPQKSWLSWVIKCAANCVYCFGFLFMLPQLFLNYKLKSVAHLPWRAFTYKAFNTFIDDVFAFIISMPTSHRLACLRDDVVFVIYMYQRYLYPVDKTRVNEFGESFEPETKKTEKPKAE